MQQKCQQVVYAEAKEAMEEKSQLHTSISSVHEHLPLGWGVSVSHLKLWFKDCHRKYSVGLAGRP